MTAAEIPDKILTEQGLVMKGVGKIARLHGDFSCTDVRLRTWQCGRIVRRDFYFVSYKMFFVMRVKIEKGKVRHLLADVRQEADRLGDMTRRYELPAASAATQLGLRLVNEESRNLLESLIAVDKALAKMQEGPMREVSEENCMPYWAAYARLKNYVLDVNRGRMRKADG